MRNESPVEVLKRVLSHWAHKHEDLEVARSRIADDIVPDFSSSDLANVAEAEFSQLSRALIVGRKAKVVVVDSADMEFLNLAVLHLCDDGRWRLESLRFQCASCFGVGAIGLSPCDTCGATGWGLAESEWLE